MKAEGWYQDPYGLHADRWFSDGSPTGLVRDGDAESNDPAPPGPVPGPLRRSVAPPVAEGDDIRRADDQAESEEAFEVSPYGVIGEER